MDGLVKGFVNMVPATLILVFAWTLGGICGGDYLDAGGFVASMVEKHHVMLEFMPAIFFLVALVLAFSTGTSWGTFAIMLPITVSVFNFEMTGLTVLTTAAVLGGSICGDHLSPISDTTILSSTGAECEHITHVESQMQYGALVAATSFVVYLVTGFIRNPDRMPGRPCHRYCSTACICSSGKNALSQRNAALRHNTYGSFSRPIFGSGGILVSFKIHRLYLK